MNKIILSLITILVTASMVTGATSAVFSAESTISGNIISTATVTISAVDGKAGDATISKPINV